MILYVERPKEYTHTYKTTRGNKWIHYKYNIEYIYIWINYVERYRYIIEPCIIDNICCFWNKNMKIVPMWGYPQYIHDKISCLSLK